MQHLIKSRAFEQVSFSTGSNGIENTFVGSVGGQNDYSRVGKLNPDTLKHAHTVKVGHLQVQQYDVREPAYALGHSLGSCTSFTYPAHVWLRAQHTGQSLTHH